MRTQGFNSEGRSSAECLTCSYSLNLAGAAWPQEDKFDRAPIVLLAFAPINAPLVVLVWKTVHPSHHWSLDNVIPVTSQDLECCHTADKHKSDVEPLRSYPQVAHGEVRHPIG